MPEQRKRVLVVDDSQEIRELLQSVLGRRSLTVDVASDGADAIDLIKRHTYAVVLLDLLMPGVDGFAVLEKLSDPGMSSPVVLVITGAERASLEQLDPQRVHGIVKKPFDPEDLASLVVACAEIKSRNAFEAMAIATIVAGGPIMAMLNYISR